MGLVSPGMLPEGEWSSSVLLPNGAFSYGESKADGACGCCAIVAVRERELRERKEAHADVQIKENSTHFFRLSLSLKTHNYGVVT
jgi:hypothetical protein